MTNKPTDAEIDAIVYEQTGFDGDGTQPMTADEMRRVTRAVLARWGQPAHRGEPTIYAQKALLEVFQKAQAGSSSTAGTLRGIAAVIASWESRTDPHTWLIAAHQPSPAAQGDALDAPVDAAVQQDAERWQFFAEYLVSTRTDLDDEIVGCDSVQKMARVLDAARAAQEGKHD